MSGSKIDPGSSKINTGDVDVLARRDFSKNRDTIKKTTTEKPVDVYVGDKPEMLTIDMGHKEHYLPGELEGKLLCGWKGEKIVVELPVKSDQHWEVKLSERGPNPEVGRLPENMGDEFLDRVRGPEIDIKRPLGHILRGMFGLRPDRLQFTIKIQGSYGLLDRHQFLQHEYPNIHMVRLRKVDDAGNTVESENQKNEFTFFVAERSNAYHAEDGRMEEDGHFGLYSSSNELSLDDPRAVKAAMKPEEYEEVKAFTVR